MPVIDAGLVHYDSIYRTVVTCDEPGCGTKYTIDIDRFYIDNAERGVDVRSANLNACIRGCGGQLKAGAVEGETRFYCSEHKPRRS